MLGFEAQEMLPDYTLDRRPELLLEVATACEGLLRVNLATLPLTSRIKLRHYDAVASSVIGGKVEIFAVRLRLGAR